MKLRRVSPQVLATVGSAGVFLRGENDWASTPRHNWSIKTPLNAGVNTIAVIAYDTSSNHNQASQSITIYFDLDTGLDGHAR